MSMPNSETPKLAQYYGRIYYPLSAEDYSVVVVSLNVRKIVFGYG